MSGLGGRDNWGIGHKREVDTRVRDEVGLELVEIDVQRTVKSQRSGD